MKDAHITLPLTAFVAPAAPAPDAAPERAAKRKPKIYAHKRRGLVARITAGKARNALVDRLRETGTAADAGRTIDTTGMSDDEFVALLRR